MGDDRKIELEVIETTKNFFLQGHDFKSVRNETLTLETAYKNATGKRSGVTVVVLVLFSLLSFMATWAITEYISLKSMSVSVDISSFRALDLANLVQDMKYNKRRIDILRSMLDDRGGLLESEIALLEENATLKIESLDRDTLGEDVYETNTRQILAERDEGIAQLRISFEQETTGIKNEISALTTEIEQQQQTLVVMRVEDKGINIPAPVESTTSGGNNANIDRLVIVDENNALAAQNSQYRRAINSLSNQLQRSERRVSDSQQLLSENRTALSQSREKFSKAQKEQAAERREYENRIRDMTRQMTSLSNEYRRFRQASDARTNDIDVVYVTNTSSTVQSDGGNYLLNYGNALEHLLRSRKDGAGYVISSTSKRLELFISSLYNVNIGDRILVFRDTILVAELVVTFVSKPFVESEIIKLSPKMQVLPFDIVILTVGS